MTMNNDDKKKMEELKEEELQKSQELTDEEIEQVAGGKVNSTLTELDEEGVDIGGIYKLTWGW